MSHKQKLHAHHRFPWHGAVGVLVLVSAIGTLSTWQPKTMDQDVTNVSSNLSTRPITTITTADGIKLQAVTVWPAGDSPVPTVILIHQFGADHHEWDQHIAKFTAAGIGVLAYDVRGFGGSMVPEVAGNRDEYLRSMNQDVPAVVTYLQSQPRVDRSKLSVMGAVLGANIGYSSAGQNLGIYRTVLLSPGDYQSALQPKNTTITPANVLGFANEKDQPLLAKIMTTAKDPKKSVLLKKSSQGVDLLKLPEVMLEIIDWLK